MTTFAAVLSCLGLLGWVYLAFFHGRFWQPLVARPSPPPALWPSIDIIVPARNEAGALPHSLPSLLAQDYPGAWRVIVVDDHSTDGTGAIAQRLAAGNNHLLVINAPNLPPGWSGKVAALNAGLAYSQADYVLFTDADIEHPKSSLRSLAARALANNLDLVSLMVKLHCVTAAEKLLIPAFVFFFVMLYPFRRSNNPASPVAAGAGGVMLIKRRALDNCGGLTRIKSELIDDCTLAKAIKENGGDNQKPGRIDITMTHDTKSLRTYEDMDEIWRMSARTAYTQLRYSLLLLIGTIVSMTIMFILPSLLPLTGWPLVTETAFAAWMVMSILYWPTIRFYDLSFIWAFTLPLAAMVYMGATIDSARLYWQGKGGQWKGRAQAEQ